MWREPEQEGPIGAHAPALGQAPIGLDAHAELGALVEGQVLDLGRLEARAHHEPNRQREGFHLESLAEELVKTMPHLFATAPERERFVAFQSRPRAPLAPLHGVARDRWLGARDPAPRAHPGPVTVTIAAGRPDKRRDVDNLAKALLDLLQAHCVIESDANVVSLTSQWDSAIAPGRIAVSVAPAIN
jgi:hypothetical protein